MRAIPKPSINNSINNTDTNVLLCMLRNHIQASEHASNPNFWSNLPVERAIVWKILWGGGSSTMRCLEASSFILCTVVPALRQEGSWWCKTFPSGSRAFTVMCSNSLSPDLHTSTAGTDVLTSVRMPPCACFVCLGRRARSHIQRISGDLSDGFFLMQMMSILFLQKKSCSSGFLFFTPSIFHWATGRLTIGWSVALLCLPLTIRYSRGTDSLGGPPWCWGPGSVFPFTDKDDTMTID